MTARALMVMGTGSDVGKSLIVTGLARAFTRRGLRVAPFKPQNMSNNAAVTTDGGEIGRAQALQARAARRAPITAMNPVLLKPEGETGSQLVVRGKRRGTLAARDYFATREKLLPEVLAAFHELAADADLVLVEGAGSASEINLRAGDIANFGFAQAADLPVILVGDIHRGGVIAALAGTFAVIALQDAARIAATVVNRFFGDPALFDGGRAALAAHTGVPCLGPVPHFPDAARLPAEDSLALDTLPTAGGPHVVAVPRWPRIANFDDLDPLRAEPAIRLVMVEPGRPLPRDARLVILPGSKATRADLAFFCQHGWDLDLAAHIRAGGAVLGLCGGYQMLGKTIADPLGLEGPPGTSQGLGHLDCDTVLAGEKQLRLESARWALGAGETLSGYHMHMGETEGPARQNPFAHIDGTPEGAVSRDGRVMGTYLHGIFASDAFRRAFLARLAIPADPGLVVDDEIEAILDALADHLEAHLDLDHLLALARPVHG